jgi:hypothetical protein
VFRDRRVDLHRHALVAQQADAAQAPRRANRHVAEPIVGVGNAPSRLIATREMPASATFAAMRSSINVPLVASAMRKPLRTPYSAMSKMSGPVERLAARQHHDRL